jgi:hypothetical protein
MKAVFSLLVPKKEKTLAADGLLRSPQTELRMTLDKRTVPIFAGHTVFKGAQNVISHCEVESQTPQFHWF